MSGLLVERPGLLTTIQDLGRPGHIHQGVPRGGAADVDSARQANRIVGNPEGAAVLECTLQGPWLRSEGHLILAVAGADLGFCAADTALASPQRFTLRPGELLSTTQRNWGARAYLAVAGGFRARSWLGSASTHLQLRKGGFGRPLRQGDRLRVGQIGADGADREIATPLALLAERPAVLRVQPGPHLQLIGRAAAEKMVNVELSVAASSDRRGVRLTGLQDVHRVGEVDSIGLLPGSVQLTPSGMLIVLLCDHPTTGGYPIPWLIGSSDVGMAAQLAPGDKVRLARQDLPEVWANQGG